MQRTSGPAASPLTWLLALVFLVVIDLGITHSAVLWGPTAFENTREITRIVFAQCYRAARKIYAPRRAGSERVAVLGNSRILIPGYEGYVQPELARIAPQRDVSLDNLGIFGAGLGDVETLSRHLGADQPRLVVIAIAADDLVVTPLSELSNVPSQLFSVGWQDGPLPPGTFGGRLDRWARTAWSLYRFHEFARAAIDDRLAPPPDPGPIPPHFADTRALFNYMHGNNGSRAEVAYEAWQRAPSLENFVAYLDVGSGGHLNMVRTRARERTPLTAESPAARVLDHLIAHTRRQGWPTVVLLMPENPLLEYDVREEYHVLGRSEHNATLIRVLAERRGATVVDARRWMPMEAFLDFDHLMPDLSGFQVPFAQEIVHALES